METVKDDYFFAHAAPADLMAAYGSSGDEPLYQTLARMAPQSPVGLLDAHPSTKRASSSPVSSFGSAPGASPSSARGHCEMCHATSHALQDFTQRLHVVEHRMALVQQQRMAAFQPQHDSAHSALLSSQLFAYADGMEYDVSSMVMTTQPSGGSVGTSRGASGPPRSDFDPYLLPFLAQSAKLSDASLEQALQTCQPHFPETTREELRSRIREWFRKHREYMTHRIDTYGKKHFRLRTRHDVMHDMQDVRNVDRIRQECSLELTADEEAREYVLERVASYFDRRERTERSRHFAHARPQHRK